MSVTLTGRGRYAGGCELSERDWTKIEVPAAPIFWTESYHVFVDALLALPIFEHSVAGKAAIERGLIKPIDRERAQKLNEDFAAEGDYAVTYLEEQLEVRWRIIQRQFHECIENG